MNIGNVTAQQVSVLVWSAATRTLTADPGAAFNVEAFALGAVPTGVGPNVYGAYVQVVASLLHSVRFFSIVASNSSAAHSINVQLATGTAGSEVVKATFPITMELVQQLGHVFLPVDLTLFPKGSRVAIRVYQYATASVDNCDFAITSGETND